jgi:hypothetical protein
MSHAPSHGPAHDAHEHHAHAHTKSHSPSVFGFLKEWTGIDLMKPVINPSTIFKSRSDIFKKMAKVGIIASMMVL